jgi:hypothetical protein
VGRPKKTIPENSLKRLLELKMPLAQIARDLGVSRPVLYKFIRKNGISHEKYSTLSEQEVQNLVAEVKKKHPNAGEVMLQGHLQSKGITLQRHKIRTAIHVVDPDGVEARKRPTIKRRVYSVPYPNYLWHIDTVQTMASRRINVSSADLADSLLEFINDDTNDIFIDESKTFSTLIHVDEDNYFWNGELSQLKSFVQTILKLTGIWTSPGGETKQFKSNEVTLKWSGQTRRKLAIIKDTEANLVANTLFNLYNNTNPIPTEASPSGNKDEMAQLKLEHPTIWAAINGIKDTLIIKLDEKSSVEESKLAKIEAELCKVRADYKCETVKLNAKYSELSLEHESTKFVLESRLKGAEFKLKETKSEVGNLKEIIQSLKYDNNFLLDILQSNESIWSKPKRTCPSKSVLDRAELSILNTFGPLEADETNVVERAT